MVQRSPKMERGLQSAPQVEQQSLVKTEKQQSWNNISSCPLHSVLISWQWGGLKSALHHSYPTDSKSPNLHRLALLAD